MKTRSNHIGGWRWRMRIFPWGYLGSWVGLALVLVLVIIVAVLIATEPAS